MWCVCFSTHSDSAFFLTYPCILCDLTIQDDLNPVGGFSLRGCLVSALDDSGVPSGESYTSLSHPTGVLLMCVYVYVLLSVTVDCETIGQSATTLSHANILDDVFHECSKSLTVCHVSPGVKGKVQGNLFKIITQSDTDYYIQAPTRQEKIDWIEAIKKLT